MKRYPLVAFAMFGALALGGCESKSPETAQTAEEPPEVAMTEPQAEPAPAETVALIDRDILFGNPVRFQGRLSPDGTRMSFRAPLNGVMNLWVGDRGDFSSVKAITQDEGRGIPQHFWDLC